jgi:hypothetical protein
MSKAYMQTATLISSSKELNAIKCDELLSVSYWGSKLEPGIFVDHVPTDECFCDFISFCCLEKNIFIRSMNVSVNLWMVLLLRVFYSQIEPVFVVL